jgi:hypothetical protein
MLGEDLHAGALVAAVTDHKLTGVLHHSNLRQSENIQCNPFRFNKTNIGNDGVTDWNLLGSTFIGTAGFGHSYYHTDKTAFKCIERELC